MNKIYKVIWSRAKNCYVVVSELAKNHRGGKKSRACVAAGILGASLLVPMGTNWAAPAVNPAGEGPGIAIGTGSSASKTTAVAIGSNGKAEGDNALALGTNNTAKTNNTMAIGIGNTTVGSGSGSFGISNNATGGESFLFGKGNETQGLRTVGAGIENKILKNNGFAFGSKNLLGGDSAYAVGSSNTVSGTAAYVFGLSNKAGGSNSLSLGDNNVSTGSRSVAVGSTNKTGGQNSLTAGYNNAVGSTSANAVVIGQNSRAGVSNTGAAVTVDPVTGAVTAAFNGEVDASNSVALGNGASVMAKNSLALGTGAKTQTAAENSIAIGINTNAQAKNSLALGNGASVSVEGGIALGQSTVGNRTAGEAGWDFATGKVSVNTSGTWVSKQGALSLGNGASVTRQITSVAAGSQDTDAVNVAQLKNATDSYVHVNGTNATGTLVSNNKGAVSATAGAAGKNSAAIGVNAKVQATAENGIAIGVNTNAQALNSIVMGNGANTSAAGTQGVAIGNGTSVSVDSGIALGANAVGNRAAGTAGWDFAAGKASANTSGTWIANRGALSLGNGVYVTRQITSVAAGTQDTDAVNVAQLKNATDSYVHVNGTNAAATLVPNNKGAVSATAGAAGKNSVAIGVSAKVQAAAENGIAIGVNTNAQAMNAIVMGNGANTSATGTQGVAIGNGASVSVDSGIALGTNAVGNRAAGTAGWDFATGKASTNTNSVWVANRGALSLGNGASVTRQITSVAAGTQDTDAVNVAQLKGLALQVSADGATYFHTNATGTAASPLFNNKGAASATAGAGGKNSLAAGINATVADVGEEGTAVGYNAKVHKEKGVALGSRSSSNNIGSMALGYNAQSHGENGVSIGTNSFTNYKGSIAIGGSARATTAGAVAIGSGANSDGTGSIAIGDTARIASNGYALTSIAMGRNAYVLNGTGQQEYQFSFNKGSWNGSNSPKAGSDALDRLPGGIAVGTNSFARTGSVEIGSHTMQGLTMGGTTVDNTSAYIIDMTTIGSNSYNKGLMATIVGSYSINTGDFDGSGGWNSFSYGSQNMGSNLIGSLNQNRSKGYSGNSGVANSIVGVANIAENANGALLFGAGNKITNSIKTIYDISTSSGFDTVDEMVDGLASAVKRSEGGATLAIGGGNTADYTQASQLIGVNNTLTGTSGSVSRYNMVNGYKNTASNVQHVSVIGSGNTVKDTDTALLLGDNRTLSGATNSLVIGSADNVATTDQQNVVVLGHNANAIVAGGVALGSGSLAAVEAGAAGYDPSTRQASTATSSTWVATGAAVSVGKGTELTRQITSVAAGTQDTDAVNVAQLKQALQAAEANDSDIHVKAGEYAVGTVQNQAGSNVQGVALDLVDKAGNAAGKVIITDVAKASDVGDLNYVAGGTGTQGKVVTNGDTVTVAIGKLDSALNQATAEAGKHSIVSAGDNISVQNTAGAGEAANYQVSLKKDITVDSVTAQTASVGGIQLNQGNSGTIGGLQNTTWDPAQIVSGQAATEDQLKAVTANVVSYDDDSHSSITLNQGGSSTVIKNVGDGSVAEGSKEAVNGGQLYRTNQAVEKNAGDIRNLGSSVNKLGSRLNRVGAGAAALAALHPQDFDPDDKWDFAAGYGNYKDAHAAAIGAFYRPSEDTLISVGGSFGGGENMVNAGVTFKLGQHNHVTRSKVAMAKEIIDLRATVEMLKNQNAQILQTLKLQGTPAAKPMEGKFSDVPETHWAYQYVEGLREQGYLEGYPDGEFKGDRTMTRYEYAAIIYRALQNGAPVDAGMAKSVEEFKPELTQVQEAERFRVDRISGKDNDRHKVERVRVNSKESKEKKEYRDVYGSRIQQEEK